MKIRKNNQNGFTLHEMLIVLGILIALLGLSIVGVVAYAKQLKITELDNAAKGIYMAAQNRAILLSGNSRLEKYVIRTDNKIEGIEINVASSETYTITAYFINSNDANIEKLLPKDSIDPELWQGNFYIVYEPESESVIDVFYFEEEIEEANEDFKTFYEKWRKASKSERMNNKPMIGYYSGIFAESGATIALRTPVINIYNTDDLKVEIIYWVPITLQLIGVSDDIKLDASLDYQSNHITLDPADSEYERIPEISYIAHKYTWTLDSLTGEQKFKNLFAISDMQYGEDFTVTGEVAYHGDESLNINGSIKKATDNSLFAKGTTDTVAKIAYTRHLQNLDSGYSSVIDSITSAEQIADIESPKCNFKPISNSNIVLYDGKEKYVKGLNIVPSEEPENFNKNVGLFDTLNGNYGQNKKLNNIRLINASMISGSKPFAGSLVGTATNVDITNCQVYWESEDAASTNLRQLLGDSEKGIQYKITSGSVSGGLVGYAVDCKITNCSASTLVSGLTVGGLIGQAGYTTISNCYSASYLEGTQVGGLIANIIGDNVKISSSYTTGFISSIGNGAKAAGMCLSDGYMNYSVNIDNAYSSMLFTVPQNGNITNYPLCETVNNYKNVYYLDSDLFDFKNTDNNCAKSYSQLTDSTNWGNLFSSDTFEKKTANNSHPYNLQTTLLLTDYIYPALPDMPHYGDWSAQFQNGSLVYYEEYQGSLYGFSGGGLEALKNDKIIVKDGYAVAYKGTEEISGVDITLTYKYTDDNGKEATQKIVYKAGSQDETAYPMYEVDYINPFTGVSEQYYLLALPDDMVDTNYTSTNFYHKITISKKDESEEKSYYYNPHFANTIVDAESSINQLAKNLIVQIRTARHFNMLSKYSDYYASNNKYNFTQQLNVNAKTYTGYNLFNNGVCTQNPIGIDANKPFKCNYYGNCNTIENFKFNVKAEKPYKYIGLFGYSTGVLEDIVYILDEKLDSFTQSGSSSDTIYAGSLVGQNDGTINNCAVTGFEISASAFDYSNIYLGGFVGVNRGRISNSAADVKNIKLSATMSNAYMGGFAAINYSGGDIYQCYTVGRLFASRSRYGEVIVSGFSSKNNGTIQKSYSANHLNSDGLVTINGFSNYAGVTSDCVYLNEGNFSYDGTNYTAQYSSDDATSVTWEQLKNITDETVSKLDMNANAIIYGNTQKRYPYPNSVVDANGNAIHYGLYPDIMNLGTMGVYYWEKLELEGNEPSYHFSVISVNGNQDVSKSSTLSTAHDDGAIITDYGYGYFYANSNNPPNVSSKNLGFDANGDFVPLTAKQNDEANKGLSELMSNQYTFNSFDTWDTNQGLYVKVDENSTDYSQPVGTLTLEQNNISKSFYINPFFADSLSYVDSISDTELNSKAGTEKNPYEVRSIEQLQFINWNLYAKNNTKPIAVGNYWRFPYLTTAQNNKKYYWQQTHDIDGTGVKNYTPIASVNDTINSFYGTIYAWFGGNYNGNDYTIMNLNINASEINAVGLFGITVNANIKNIVLYSQKGDNIISLNSNQARWYAIGGLVGLAANTENSDSTIENCSVAGYNIIDRTKGIQSGGGGVGGLAGICNMALSNCSAVTTINLEYTHSEDNRNLRVGGLVGSCQQNITNCYAGGQIIHTATDKKTKNHIGGIVGGYFMKSLKLGGNTGLTVGNPDIGDTGLSSKKSLIKNCYSYVKLPNISKMKQSLPNRVNDDSEGSNLFAIGGMGEIRFKDKNNNQFTGENRFLAEYENCYYLDSCVSNIGDVRIWDDPNGQGKYGVKSCSYSDLAVGGDVFNLFQSFGFGEVTKTTSNNEAIDGRFSFGINSKLLGTNYPFPTILTQSSDLIDDGIANVHYGDWPIQGIERENGTLPVNLDLFITNKYEEAITLSNVEIGGEWKLDYDNSLFDASLEKVSDREQKLSLQLKKQGSTKIIISYTVNGDTYKLSIDVNITANLQLVADGTVIVFTNETAIAPLKLQNMNGQLISNDIIKSFNVEAETSFFGEASIPWSEGQTEINLQLTSLLKTGLSRLTVGYEYEYLGNLYYSTSVIAAEVRQMPDISIKPITIEFDKDSSNVMEEVEFTSKNIEITIDEKPIENIEILGFENIAEYKEIAFAKWKNEENIKEGIIIEGYKPINNASAVIRVQIKFSYGGSVHTVWQNLQVNVNIKEQDQQ